MASPIESTWAHAAVMIETPAGSTGTGFLVGRPTDVQGQWRVFLVTNKHVLSKDPAQRAAMRMVRLHVNVNKAGALMAQTVEYPLSGPEGSWFREHPSPEVDVLAIGVSALFNLEGLANKFVSEEMFATAAKRAQLEISAGEDIVTVGYPSGIRQGKTNFPLIRQGIIATRVGEELHENQLAPDGTRSVRVTRGFLIDGATIPGSSGSPVILKPVTGRQHGNALILGSAPPVLLGIVAETRFAPIPVGGAAVIPGFAGLGLAFDVETIVETIDLFG